MILLPGSQALVNFMCFSNISTPVNGVGNSAFVYRNTTLTSITPTVNNPIIGFYQIEFTVPSNWEEGDIISVVFESTINGLATRAHKIAGTVSLQVLDIYQRLALDPDNPVSLSRVDNITTESFAGKTLTHVVDENNDSVTSTRS